MCIRDSAVACVVAVVVVGLHPGNSALRAGALGNQHVADEADVNMTAADGVTQAEAVEGQRGVHVLLLAVRGGKGLALIRCV